MMSRLMRDPKQARPRAACGPSAKWSQAPEKQPAAKRVSANASAAPQRQFQIRRYKRPQ